LEAGERVVSHGAFSLDAELQIQGGKSMMTMPDDLEREHGRPFSVPKKELANLTPVLRVALSLQQALSKDDFGAAKAAFGELKSAAESAKVRAPTDAAKRWDEIQEELIRYAGQGAQAKTIDEARKQFEKLSQRLIEVTRRYGNPIDAKVRLAFCPMAFDGKGAEWLQEEEGVQNPFLGSKMYGCGDIRASASSGELLPPAKTDEGHVPAPAGHQH
jgi:Cu(I)/Ag(I) efflux system membrane fusion protein